MKPVLFYLGLCAGFTPGDLVFSHELCVMEIEARARVIVPHGTLSDRPQFQREVDDADEYFTFACLTGIKIKGLLCASANQTSHKIE